MIKGIFAKNFRIIKDYQEFDFKPLTLLTGPNNSGKSSIINILDFLAIHFPPNQSLSHFQLKENISAQIIEQFGGYENIINKDNSENETFTVGLKYYVKELDSLLSISFEYDKLGELENSIIKTADKNKLILFESNKDNDLKVNYLALKEILAEVKEKEKKILDIIIDISLNIKEKLGENYSYFKTKAEIFFEKFLKDEKIEITNLKLHKKNQQKKKQKTGTRTILFENIEFGITDKDWANFLYIYLDNSLYDFCDGFVLNTDHPFFAAVDKVFSNSALNNSIKLRFEVVISEIIEKNVIPYFENELNEIVSEQEVLIEEKVKEFSLINENHNFTFFLNEENILSFLAEGELKGFFTFSYYDFSNQKVEITDIFYSNKNVNLIISNVLEDSINFFNWDVLFENFDPNYLHYFKIFIEKLGYSLAENEVDSIKKSIDDKVLEIISNTIFSEYDNRTNISHIFSKIDLTLLFRIDYNYGFMQYRIQAAKNEVIRDLVATNVIVKIFDDNIEIEVLQFLEKLFIDYDVAYDNPDEVVFLLRLFCLLLYGTLRNDRKIEVFFDPFLGNRIGIEEFQNVYKELEIEKHVNQNIYNLYDDYFYINVFSFLKNNIYKKYIGIVDTYFLNYSFISRYLESYKKLDVIKTFGVRNKSLSDNDELSKLIKKLNGSGNLISVNEKLNKFSKFLGIADNIIIEIDETINSFKIYLEKNNTKVLLQENGHGIVQLFPLLILLSISDQYSPKEYLTDTEKELVFTRFPYKFLVVQEPEISLHPALQSKLADLFSGITESTGCIVIIETHSEYLIRKLQYLTAKKQIDKNDLVIYYFNQKNNDVPNDVFFPINVNDDGKLSREFGPGFFDEADNIALDIFLLSQSQSN